METILMILGIVVTAVVVGTVGSYLIERAHDIEDPWSW